jgi:replication factor C subunit 1
MPLDIRDFFKAKGSAAKPKSSSSAAFDKNKKSKDSLKAAGNKRKATSTPSKSKLSGGKKLLSPIIEEGPVKARAPKHKTIILEDSDTDATTDGDGKHNQTIANDDNERDDEKPVAKASPHFNNNKKKGSLANKPKNLKEVSSEDFFAADAGESKSKRTSLRNIKPRGSYVFNDDDDDDEPEDEFEVDNMKSSSSKRKKSGDDFDDEDIEGTDLDDDFKPQPVEKGKRPSPKAAKTPPTKPERKPSPYKKKKVEKEQPVDIDFNDEKEGFKPIGTPSRGINTRGAFTKSTPDQDTPPSSKKRKATTTSSNSKKKIPVKNENEPLLEPSLELDEFDEDKAFPECFVGLTFVFTGVLEDGFSREDASDFVKTLGGRVTGSVSGRTSYLVVGGVLEDGRPYKDGKKFQASQGLDNCKVVVGKKQLYGLAKLYCDKVKAHLPLEEQFEDDDEPSSELSTILASAESAPSLQVPKKPAVVNPYAKKGAIVNPYSQKSLGTNPYGKKASAPQQENSSMRKKTDANDLWVDIYAPASTRDILGNKDCVTKLTTCKRGWHSVSLGCLTLTSIVSIFCTIHRVGKVGIKV